MVVVGAVVVVGGSVVEVSRAVVVVANVVDVDGDDVELGALVDDEEPGGGVVVVSIVVVTAASSSGASASAGSARCARITPIPMRRVIVRPPIRIVYLLTRALFGRYEDSQLVRPWSTRSMAQSSSSLVVTNDGMKRSTFPSGPHSMMISSRSNAYL